MAPSTPPPAPTPSPTPAPAPTPVVMPTPTPPPAPTVLRSASIRGANGHSAAGTAEIVQDGRSYTLEFRSGFRIDGGLNDVYLSRDPGVVSSSDLNVGNLRSLSGPQGYALPNDGGSYRYVLLWCRPFRVPIALGELR